MKPLKPRSKPRSKPLSKIVDVIYHGGFPFGNLKNNTHKVIRNESQWKDF
jgi:hypothetical protein